MPTYHKIAQGEYLTQIALRYGFVTATTIWDDPHNAQLKQKRKSPHVLFPGDILYIPDKTDKNHGAPTTRTNNYVVPSKKVTLKLTLLDWDQTPIASTQCTLRLDSQILQLTTDGSGKIEKEISTSASQGTLTVTGFDEEFAVQIGGLDPSSEDSGLQGRLRNLAYLMDADEPDQPTLDSAVQEFQCNAKIHVDGVVGPQTLAKLETTHGS